jgi:hypothetical protein
VCLARLLLLLLLLLLVCFLLLLLLLLHLRVLLKEQPCHGILLRWWCQGQSRVAFIN